MIKLADAMIRANAVHEDCTKCEGLSGAERFKIILTDCELKTCWTDILEISGDLTQDELNNMQGLFASLRAFDAMMNLPRESSEEVTESMLDIMFGDN
jgi:hypothetical protein